MPTPVADDPMTPRGSKRARAEAASDEFIRSVVQAWSAYEPVRRRTPSGIHVHIDRPSPFMCLYRRTSQGADPGTRRLVTGESSYLIAPDDPTVRREVRRLVLALGAPLVKTFGAFVLFDVWAGDPANPGDPDREVHPEPRFRIFARSDRALTPTVKALERALGKVRILKRPANVEVVREDGWSPLGRARAVPHAQLARVGGAVIGIEVDPIYRNAQGVLFPVLLRNLKRQVSASIKRAVYRFAMTRTHVPPPLSYKSLGQRLFAKSIERVDERLSDLARSYEFLLEVTPVNLESAWGRFSRSRFQRSPEFLYRPLPLDPVVTKRRLFDIPVDRIEEPTLARLFRDKQLQIDRELSLMIDRGTRRFLYGSLQIYGTTSRELLALARSVLEEVPPSRSKGRSGRSLDAEAFAERAREEIARYRALAPTFASQAIVRDDIYSGLMVSRGNLLIGHKARIPAGQVTALLHHEIGTHALTFHNGRCQPFRQLADGLPGYDELQEGLAVLSEYLCGGLTGARLRLLAARVVAAHLVEQGATFVDAFRVLHRQFGVPQKGAFTVAARVYRGGGLTKDAVYLRGLAGVLELLARGEPLAPLFRGKFAAGHLPMIEELQLRGMLHPNPLRPRVLDEAGMLDRLQRLRDGATVLDLHQRSGR